MPYTLDRMIVAENGNVVGEKRLSICVDADGFSFAETTCDSLLKLGNVKGEHAASMTDVCGEVKQLLGGIGIRPIGYSHIELIVMSDENVWVPNELYAAASNKQYMKLVGGKAKHLMSCDCKEMESTAVFVADEHVVMGFKVALPGVAVMSQHVKMATSHVDNGRDTVLLVNRRNDVVDMAIYKKGRYVYGNSMMTRSVAEVKFKILEVARAYEADCDGGSLLMCGDVDREIFMQMRPYFPTVELYAGRKMQCNNTEYKKYPVYRHALMLM